MLDETVVFIVNPHWDFSVRSNPLFSKSRFLQNTSNLFEIFFFHGHKNTSQVQALISLFLSFVHQQSTSCHESLWRSFKKVREISNVTRRLTWYQIKNIGNFVFFFCLAEHWSTFSPSISHYEIFLSSKRRNISLSSDHFLFYFQFSSSNSTQALDARDVNEWTK